MTCKIYLHAVINATCLENRRMNEKVKSLLGTIESLVMGKKWFEIRNRNEKKFFVTKEIKIKKGKKANSVQFRSS